MMQNGPYLFGLLIKGIIDERKLLYRYFRMFFHVVDRENIPIMCHQQHLESPLDPLVVLFLGEMVVAQSDAAIAAVASAGVLSVVCKSNILNNLPIVDG